jgi:energy-coupling factor transporter ATP-binding protein EcfA2
MTKRIEGVTLDCFRGATGKITVDFDVKKPIVLLFGENGTGKSTIVDGIDLICNRCSGSLQTRSSTKTSDLVSLGMAPKDMKVELRFGGQVWNGSLTGQRILVSPSPSPPAYVLRRSQLITLVEDDPKKRYERLAKFIDVGGVEKVEESLRSALKTSVENYNFVAHRFSDADAALKVLWEREGEPDVSWAVWAKTKAEQDQTLLASRLQLFQEAKDTLVAVEAAKESASTARASVATAAKGVQLLKDNRPEALEGRSDSASLVELLKKAESVLATLDDPDSCPVCEGKIDGAWLSVQLRSRIESLAAFDAYNLSLQDAQRSLAIDLDSASRQLKAYFAATEKMITAHAALPDEFRAKLCAEPLVAKYVEGRHGENACAKADEFVDAMLASQHLLDIEISTSISDQNQFNAIKGHHENLTDTGTAVIEAKELKERLEATFNVVHKSRIDFTQHILDAICSEVNALYDRIHPNEPLGLQCFRLDPKFKGSLHQNAYFEGVQDISPQAYFSESHLDTLGLCIYLATVKWSKDPNAILVLDDIFTSVDSVHMTRMIDLLTEEAVHFAQVFIATHSRQWSDYYRFSAGASNLVDVIELHHWSRGNGIRIKSSKLATDELRHFIAPINWDRQIVGSKAGILLEHALDYLTLLYGCSLPRSGEAYTIGALLSGFKKTGDVMRVIHHAGTGTSATTQVVEVKEILRRLADIAFIRNRVGCHFNKDGLSVPDQEVEEFAKLTLEFSDAIICQACGALPSPNKKNSDGWLCACKKTVTQPLLRP